MLELYCIDVRVEDIACMFPCSLFPGRSGKHIFIEGITTLSFLSSSPSTFVLRPFVLGEIVPMIGSTISPRTASFSSCCNRVPPNNSNKTFPSYFTHADPLLYSTHEIQMETAALGSDCVVAVRTDSLGALGYTFHHTHSRGTGSGHEALHWRIQLDPVAHAQTSSVGRGRGGVQGGIDFSVTALSAADYWMGTVADLAARKQHGTLPGVPPHL